jgi:hypothetical protein
MQAGLLIVLKGDLLRQHHVGDGHVSLWSEAPGSNAFAVLV